MKPLRILGFAGVAALGVLVALGASAGSSEVRGPAVNPRAVAQCVALTLGPLEFHRNVALVHASLHVKQSLANCGCVSSKLKYVARRSDPDGDSTVLSIGAVDTIKHRNDPDPVVLVAASDGAQSIDFEKVTLSLDCL